MYCVMLTSAPSLYNVYRRYDTQGHSFIVTCVGGSKERTYLYCSTVVPLLSDHPMVLNIRGISRGVVCDQGEVELVGGAKYTLYESSRSETARRLTVVSPFFYACVCMRVHA